MRGLLVLLSVIAILGALFAGRCSVLTVGEFLRHGPGGQYESLQRFVASIAAGVGFAAVAVLTANVWILMALRGRPTPRRRALAVGLACMDVASAVGAFAWILWGDPWGLADGTWSWLAKAGAVALALKGVLIWRLVGRSATAAADARES